MKCDIKPHTIEISIKPKTSRSQLLPPFRYGNLKEARFKGIDIVPGVKPTMGGVKFICKIGQGYTNGDDDVILIIYTNDVYAFRSKSDREWFYYAHLAVPHPVLSVTEGPGYIVIGCSMSIILLRVNEKYDLERISIPCGRNSFSFVYVDDSSRLIAVSYSGELFVWDVDQNDLSALLIINCNLGVGAVKSFSCIRIEKTGIHRAYLVSEDTRVHVYDILYETVTERHPLDYRAEAVDIVNTGGTFYIAVFQPNGAIILLDKLGSIREHIIFAKRNRLKYGIKTFKIQKIYRDMFVLVAICKKGFLAPYFIYKNARVIEAMSSNRAILCQCARCFKSGDDINMLIGYNDSIFLIKYSFYLKPERLTFLVMNAPLSPTSDNNSMKQNSVSSPIIDDRVRGFHDYYDEPRDNTADSVSKSYDDNNESEERYYNALEESDTAIRNSDVISLDDSSVISVGQNPDSISSIATDNKDPNHLQRLRLDLNKRF